MEGFVENGVGIPLISRIHLRYHVKVPKGRRAEAERVIHVHENGRPVAQSVQTGIQLHWEGRVEEEAGQNMKQAESLGVNDLLT